MLARRVTFGPFLLNAEVGTLLRDGEPIAVGGRGVRLLQALLERPGEVVTKAELMDAAWPGMAVEESNLTVQIALLRKALSPSPDGRDWIATMPRIGYRFVGPATGSVQASPAGTQRSLAVLPFANLDNDPEQDFFADGLADEIITTLSRLSGLVVAARSLSFAYRGSTTDLRRIASDLHVRYILEGSVRRSGSRIRMAARLIDGETGGQVWADRYDRELADVFAIQDDVTRRIVEALEVTLGPMETPTLGQARTRDIEALGWFLRARAMMRGPGQNAEIFAQSTEFLRCAIDRDPAYAEAHAAMATALVLNYLNQWRGDPDQSLSDARRVADEGVRIDPRNPFTHFAAGLAAMFSRDLQRVASEVETVLTINPHDANAITLRGNICLYSGEPLAAIPDIERAMHLDPGFGHLHLHLLGMAHLVAGQYETAAKLFRERILQVPQTDMTRAYLAAALGHLGKTEEAMRVIHELHDINPNYSLIERLGRLPFKNQADVDGIVAGWRRAGFGFA
jgi:TolB-like protein/Flp pilus assembly protein TadD